MAERAKEWLVGEMFMKMNILKCVSTMFRVLKYNPDFIFNRITKTDK